MRHELLGGESTFFSDLIKCDEKLAEATWCKGCPFCGGRLDRADYPRKPRGLPAQLEEAFSRRYSFCCAKEGCRRRSTPPSLRFFGRRVYIAAIILVICGRLLTARRAAVPKNTARRWRRHFSTGFRDLPFWQRARGLLMPPIDEGDLVASLLSRFGGDRVARLHQVLHFLSPVTTRSAGEMMAR